MSGAEVPRKCGHPQPAAGQSSFPVMKESLLVKRKSKDLQFVREKEA
jgi:hypothetical protein